MSLWAAAWSPAHSSVCMCPLHPQQQQRQEDEKNERDPLIKQGWMEPCEATFPSFWAWYLLSTDSRLFKGREHSCRPPQIWDSAALTAPRILIHTHTHTHRAVQTHFYPLLPLLTYQCRSEERSLVCILCVLLFTNNFISGCFSISTYSVVTDSFATREQQTLIFYWLQWCTCSFLWVFLSFSVTFSFLNDPYAQGVRRGQDFSIGTEGVWLIIISKRAFALNRQFVIMFLFFISIT